MTPGAITTARPAGQKQIGPDQAQRPGPAKQSVRAPVSQVLSSTAPPPAPVIPAGPDYITTFTRPTFPAQTSQPSYGGMTVPAGALYAYDAPSFLTALASLPNGAGCIECLPGSYVFTDTIDLSQPFDGAVRGHLYIRGSGISSQFNVTSPGRPCFDLTNANECTFEDIQTQTNGSCGFLLAKSNPSQSAGGHTFVNCNLQHLSGGPTVEIVGCSNNSFVGCTLQNFVPGGNILRIGSSNVGGLSSPARGSLSTGLITMDNRFTGARFYGFASNPNSVDTCADVWIEGFVEDLSIRDGYMSPANQQSNPAVGVGGRSYYIDSLFSGIVPTNLTLCQTRYECNNPLDREIVFVNGRVNALHFENSNVYTTATTFAGGVYNCCTVQGNVFHNTWNWSEVWNIDTLDTVLYRNNYHWLDNWHGNALGPNALQDVLITAKEIHRSDLQVDRTDYPQVVTLVAYDTTFEDALGLQSGGGRVWTLKPNTQMFAHNVQIA